MIDRYVSRILSYVKPRPRQNLGRLTLPHEILLQISSHLTNTSHLSLALTCRALHTILLSRKVSLSKADQEALLLLLEKDAPGLYFCHYCTKLHQWRASWKPNTFGCILEDLPCVSDLSKSQVRMSNACRIPYHYARLVMNRHLYGPSHGLSLHKLQNVNLIPSSHSRISETGTLDASILDGQLLLLSIVTLHHRRGNNEELREYVEKHGPSICAHITLSTGFPDSAPYKLPNSQERKSHQRSSILVANRMVHACTVQQITALTSRHEERTKGTR